MACELTHTAGSWAGMSYADMLVMHVIQPDISTSRCGCLSMVLEASRCRCLIRV